MGWKKRFGQTPSAVKATVPSSASAMDLFSRAADRYMASRLVFDHLEQASKAGDLQAVQDALETLARQCAEIAGLYADLAMVIREMRRHQIHEP